MSGLILPLHKVKLPCYSLIELKFHLCSPPHINDYWSFMVQIKAGYILSVSIFACGFLPVRGSGILSLQHVIQTWLEIEKSLIRLCHLHKKMSR